MHFHEVGSVDSIADILLTAVAMDYLNPRLIVCSALPMGFGMIRGAAHGPLPSPAPATVTIACLAGE